MPEARKMSLRERLRIPVADVVDAVSRNGLASGIYSVAWSAVTGKPSVNTTAPLTGGGSLASSLTLAVSTMTGDSGAGGARGVVPAPAAGDTAAGKFLKASGTWVTPPVGAPDSADYLVRTANGSLSAERVVTDTTSVVWDWATAGQAKATVPNLVGDAGAGGTAGLVPAPAAGDAAAGKFLKADGTWAAPPPGTSTTAGLVKLGATGGALAYTATVQTIPGATGTVTDGTEIVRVTHAAVTALTLPALANTTRPVVFLGPAAVAGTTPTCVFARAGSDVIDSGATGLKIEGSNWRVTFVSDGAVWRVTDVRGVAQLPVGYVDLTGVSGSSPWTRTDGVSGETVTMTDTSTAGTTSAASGIQMASPAGATAVFTSNTGTGFYTDLLARAGLDPVRDEYAVLVKAAETSTPAATDTTAVFLGTTIAATPKGGISYNEVTGALTTRFNTVSVTVATVATGHAAKGFWWDGRTRSWEALEGAWTGTAQTTLWPLLYAKPGGVEKHLTDPNTGASGALDFAGMSRLVVAVSNGSGGARNWLAEYLYVVRILRG